MPPVTTSESPEQSGSSSASSILKERRFKLSRACDRCRRTATLEDRMHQLETLIKAIPPAVFAAGGNSATLDSIKSLLPDSAAGLSPTSPTAAFPSGIPPPSLHVFPLTNPSTHFAPSPNLDDQKSSPSTTFQSFMCGLNTSAAGSGVDQLGEEVAKLSISDSYLYTDDEGYTRWQGETSGLPFLDLLIERRAPEPSEPNTASPSPPPQPAGPKWFPNRTSKRMDVNPQTLWRMITGHIPPDLMDRQSCSMLPLDIILHSPLPAYPDLPRRLRQPPEMGRTRFCYIHRCDMLSSFPTCGRSSSTSCPNNGITAGTRWFELLGQLRILPIADRPTLYTIQADLVAAIYAVGLGRLSKAAALLSEAVTISIDAGLHRSSDTYDLFDPIEDEVRKRTFWCVYTWDKQLSAHFGRPPIIRLRDCDVSEPAPVDDEYISKDGIGTPPPGTECRMGAFIYYLRIMMVLESVLDVPIPRPASSPFMRRVASVLSSKGSNELREEEMLLDEIHNSIPSLWSQSPETVASEDIIRLTQAERLYCAEHFVRLLIYRHRFSHRVGERLHSAGDEEQKQRQSDGEREAMIAAHNSALQIIATHAHIAGKGLMTYCKKPIENLILYIDHVDNFALLKDGVHVIHQLTQAGRTLVAVLLCCKSEAMQPLISPGLDALRSCVGLLRRFSGRYVCGLRSGDLLEEFCRLTQIPLEPSRADNPQDNSRPAWIRPVRKKIVSTITRSSQSGESHHSSPEAFSPTDFFTTDTKPFLAGTSTDPQSQFIAPTQGSSLENTEDFINSGLLRENSHLFLSPTDMLLFGDADGMDLSQMVPSDFMQSTP
ncbi:hypothetical protein AAF712_001654 [Marasmius tenuissimus]|uniref:Xylanolytic transcriptional activator regulatory domain-containing protein n=1 Tax=Marasmius tenuissimus TaxID=585030 RepID=A0ABR3AB12_9AGAR